MVTLLSYCSLHQELLRNEDCQNLEKNNNDWFRYIETLGTGHGRGLVQMGLTNINDSLKQLPQGLQTRSHKNW
jgi:hypothetical protein